MPNVIVEKVGNNLESIDTGDNFLHRTPVAHALRSKIDKRDRMKLQSSFKAR